MNDISLSKSMMKQEFWAGVTAVAILGILFSIGSWGQKDKLGVQMTNEQPSSIWQERKERWSQKHEELYAGKSGS